MRGYGSGDVCLLADTVPGVRSFAHGHRHGRVALPDHRHDWAGVLRGSGNPARYPSSGASGHHHRHLLHHLLRRGHTARCKRRAGSCSLLVFFVFSFEGTVRTLSGCFVTVMFSVVVRAFLFFGCSPSLRLEVGKITCTFFPILLVRREKARRRAANLASKVCERLLELL